MSSTRTVSVALGERSYNISVGSGLIARGAAADLIAEQSDQRSPVCIVTHPALRERYAEPIRERLAAVRTVTVKTVPPGERFKTLRTVAGLYEAFLDAGLDRRSTVAAVGGGVPGDTAGFAAATYMRGIRFVQVPTTLLAQVDAAVGGKTGVDLPGGKNLAGAFHQPSAVVVDTDTLLTLPIRELRAGLAEVLKYGVIYDADFFDRTCEDMPRLLRRDADALTLAVFRSCEIKAEVVGKDETEQGVRAILNFGHTVGHALEAITQYRTYRHGEAISIGMVTESILGEELGITPPDCTVRIIEALRNAGLPVGFPAHISSEAIVGAAMHDKKTVGGQMNVVLVEAIGRVIVSGKVTPGLAARAIDRHRTLQL